MNKAEIVYKPYNKDGQQLTGEERKRKVQQLMASMIFNYLEKNAK